MRIKKIYLIMFGMILFNFVDVVSVSALSAVVHVPENYVEVITGERFYFEVGIKYPENPSRKDLALNYEVLTQDGKVIAQAKVLKAVETQASFIDFIIIPEIADSGMHIIKVKISDYESLEEEVEASFHVVSGSGGKIRLYFFILLGAVVLVAGLVVWQILELRRSKNLK